MHTYAGAMWRHFLRDLLRSLLLWIVLAAGLAGCGGTHDGDTGGTSQPSQASQAGIKDLRQVQGVNVFVATLSFELRNYDDLGSITYSIAPRAGAYSRPLTVTFDKSWLDRRGAYSPASRRLALPVFGLYAAHRNTVALTAGFRDGSRQALRATLATGAYSGPAELYARPEIRVARSAERVPGFDYVLIRNRIGAPVVIDTDGQMRWTGAGLDDSTSTLFADGRFYVGSPTDALLHRMELDGSFTSVRLDAPHYTSFHHELAPGKTGMLAELDASEGGVDRIESILAEIGADGKVIKGWDLGRIFSDAMRSAGDNPAGFVREGTDWFHMNSAVYDAADNALLVSSREHFVVKLDYDTGAIRWLFGDTTKHWYLNYPSLRALALRLLSGKAPIGQHALSITSDGQLLLFNNGWASISQLPAAPPGITRGFSAPSRYQIDEQTRSAREVWTYERNRELYSDICSSVLESTPGNYLVAYSVAEGRPQARLLAVDSLGRVAFDFAYPTYLCDSVFSAQPLAWTDLVLR